MNIQRTLLSAHEYSLLGQTEGGTKVVFWRDKGFQGEISSVVVISVYYLSCYKRLKKFLLLWNLKWLKIEWFKKKRGRVQSSMINFMDKFQYMLEESSCQQEAGLKNNYSFQEKMFRGIWWCLVEDVITWKFLLWYGSIKFLDLFLIGSHYILENVLKNVLKMWRFFREFSYTFRTTIL